LKVVLVDAKDFDDQDQPGNYVDSTAFSFEQRLAFTKAVLMPLMKQSGLPPRWQTHRTNHQTVEGERVTRAEPNLYMHTWINPDIVNALKARALAPAAWELVRTNFERWWSS